MDSIHAVIAENIKRLREERKLSLDGLAKLSGVSKSMLGQIERGDVNPTISTLWKNRHRLQARPSPELLNTALRLTVRSSPKRTCSPLSRTAGVSAIILSSPFDSARRFEMYMIEMDAGSHLEADPHPEGTQEFITVFSGTLAVTAGEEQMLVDSGGSLRFRADKVHGYKNVSEEECKLSMVIFYP